MTTTTYRVTGKLIHPVNDVQAARHYLREQSIGIEQHIYPESLKYPVHTIRWDLEDEDTWEVIIVMHRPLLDDYEARILSDWISGQNSDGLGEGFEQQPFAEHEDEEDEDDCHIIMSSFDWEDNPCLLMLVK